MTNNGWTFRALLFLAGFSLCPVQVFAAETFNFGVLNQRSITLTAELWNPILRYVSARSGVPLTLKMGKTAAETTRMTVGGEFDFVYTNHLFTPERDKLGYRVIARFNTPGIRGQIVAPETSPIQNLKDLEGKEVAFPTPDGFTGYWVPMDGLLRAGVHVKPIFTGNQESSMARLVLGSVVAAGVNSQVMENYARREGFKYRVFYASDPYLDLPIMVNPRVSQSNVEKVRRAFVDMATDAEGQKILQAATALLKSKEMLGFVPAENSDYDNYRRFYRSTLVRE